jgi:trans-aconitate methyltransferase
MTTSNDSWDASLYDQRHGFVHQLAVDLVDLLRPKAGESILDVGCGTGHLTQLITAGGADVMGIDSSASMIAEARRNFPSIQFDVADATTMQFDTPFDAVFSNAALHWVKPPQAAVERMAAALRPGGRLVVEFGGKGNVRQVLDAAATAGREMGIDLRAVLDINYFPSVSEYTSLLEQRGFEVRFATLFDRMTKLNDLQHGLRDWIRMFRTGVFERIPAQDQDRFFSTMERIARPVFFRDGAWHADYRRLRLSAVRI